MKHMFVAAGVVLAALIAPGIVLAQDVAITNARIIVGSGQVIDSGTIIVKGGKIVSVTAGPAPGPRSSAWATATCRARRCTR